MEFFLVTFSYFFIGFVLVSLFTKFRAKHWVDCEIFIFGIIFWPFVTLFNAVDWLDKTCTKHVPNYCEQYMKWLQKRNDDEV